MYTLREFRANTKQAFDDAASGHEVVISRGNENFQLVALVGDPLPGHTQESKAPPVIKEPKQVLESVPVEKPCRHGFPAKYCKYAKPGKPCK